MISFSGQAILLDIEGTTSSVRFVYDQMFPFVREHLDRFLADHWQHDSLKESLELLANDLDYDSFEIWCGDKSPNVAQRKVANEVIRLMDGDIKATGLKSLQGLIWKSGFNSGVLRAHLYDDVVPALDRWLAAGKEIRVYSSGSIHAQKLFFGHSIHGNILDRFRGHFDTTTGSKKEAASYTTIAAEFAIPPSEILFVSDIVAELDAASAAGFAVALSLRPENEPQPPHSYPTVESFDQIQLVG